MMSLLYQDNYNTLENMSQSIDSAIAARDKAINKANGLSHKVKDLNVELAKLRAVKENSTTKEREFLDKLIASEATKNEAIVERGRLVEENNKISEELAIAQAKILGLENDLVAS